VPDIWHQLANCTKWQEYQVINERIQEFARSPHSFNKSHPIISARLVQDIVSFNFVGETMDDIKTGLQPFAIASGSAEHCQANLEIAQMFGLLNSGDHSIMLSNLESLKAKEVQSIPLTYFELERNLGMFGNLLGTILGPTHRLTAAYRELWELLTVAFQDQVQPIIDDKHYVKPAHILCLVQLECFEWFVQRRMHQRPPDPVFSTILRSLIRNTYVIPHLPPVLYRLAYAKLNPGNTGTTPSLGTNTTASSSSSGSSGGLSSGSSNTSVISGVTLPTFTGTGVGTATQGTKKGSFVVNLNPDRELQALVDYGIKLGDVINLEPPPLLDDGNQVCLAYFVRSGDATQTAGDQLPI